MLFAKSLALVGAVVSAVVFAAPELEKKSCGTACYTSTLTLALPCPASTCSPTHGQTSCTSTKTFKKHVPPSGSCPTPTTTVDGNCSNDCFACPSVTKTSTGCYTSTVTTTTGFPPPCPFCTPTCYTTATVTAPPKKCDQCKTTKTVTTSVPYTCQYCDGGCSAVATETVSYYG